MKHIFFLLLFFSQTTIAQQKKNHALISRLQSHINYLADDKLEGRSTGTAGEKLAAEYISNHFKKAGLKAPGKEKTYLQTFEVNEGRELSKGNSITVNGNKSQIDYFPFAYSASGNFQLVKDKKSLADTFDIGPLLEENKSNPHFDLHGAIVSRAKTSEENKKIALIVFNRSTIKDDLKFDPKDKTPTVGIPVIYIKSLGDNSYVIPTDSNIQLNVSIEHKKRIGHNVTGFIDNGASSTIVIGAHYDHLGYGEDHNSLHTGEKMIHNGADDNASGTAALIELAYLLNESDLKKNNYLFVAFSGEELGLFGSKYFVEHSPVNLNTINYMINMDMVGRLDTTKGITVGGYGTSPAWSELLTSDNTLKVKFDSSGTGPSDHTSFYRKDIPVLFFFTGTHIDYHKPSDDAHKINYAGEAMIIDYIYKLIGNSDKKGKLAFLKTREATMVKSSFKVSLGIMPDYTFTGDGVRVDGVIDGRAAQKAGIKTGDIIQQLGAHKFTDVQSYMQALNQFNKGESTKVKVNRGSQDLVFDITF